MLRASDVPTFVRSAPETKAVFDRNSLAFMDQGSTIVAAVLIPELGRFINCIMMSLSALTSL